MIEFARRVTHLRPPSAVLMSLSIALVAGPARSPAQNPLRHWTEAIDSRFATRQPVVTYTLRVDSANLSGFDVSMSVRGRRDTTVLAMVAHPEYDDKYWRFVRDVRVEGARGSPGRARRPEGEDHLGRGGGVLPVDPVVDLPLRPVLICARGATFPGPRPPHRLIQ